MRGKRERLSKLARGRRPGPDPFPPPSVCSLPLPEPLSDQVPGTEVRTPRGKHWRHERRIGDAAHIAAARESLRPGALAEAESGELLRAGDPGIEGALFLDLETCGFAGTPLFLAGALWVDGDQAELVQLLARSYAEEASVVEGLLELLTDHPLLVTFNGKSYDLPFLRDRAVRFGLPLPAPAGHLDLLHAARRRWKKTLPDCRLTTLEKRLTGHHRVGDVAGSEVPDRYHAFVRRGAFRDLAPVLRHNRRDLLTLLALLGSLSEVEFM